MMGTIIKLTKIMLLMMGGLDFKANGKTLSEGTSTEKSFIAYI